MMKRIALSLVTLLCATSLWPDLAQTQQFSSEELDRCNPEKDALYLNVTPAKNDGKTVYKLQVKDVPVDGFWSISVYNDKGYFEPNPQSAYTLNNLTAKADADDSITIQFGGCDGTLKNCLPTPSGWNYMVRLYRPRPEILSGKWTFPQPQPVQ